MEVLQVISSFPPAYSYGGPLKATFLISKGLQKKGHNVTVFTTDVLDKKNRLSFQTNPSIYEDGIKVHHFKNINNSLAYRNIPIAPNFFFTLKKEIKKFDIIHIQEYITFQSECAGRLAYSNKVPYIVQPRGSLSNEVTQKMLKQIYDHISGVDLIKKSNHVIALTSHEYQQCIQFGCDRNKLSIIPNCYDFEEIKSIRTTNYLRQSLNLPDDAIIILFLGRLHIIKGVDILIKAFEKLLKKYNSSPAIYLVIAGPDGGSLNYLTQLVAKLKLTSNVHFIGPQYDKNKWLCLLDCDIFVLPSRYETFPNVVLEAYACKKPVIATSVAAIPDLVLDSQTGYIFPNENYDILSTCLDILIKNKELRLLFGRNGMKFIEKYSQNNVVSTLEKLYYDVIKKKV